MPETEAELRERVRVLDRRVDKMYSWASAVLLTASLTMGMNAFWTYRWIDRTEAGMQVALPQIQTDVALIKRDQENWREENKRAWQLISRLLKEQANDK